MLPWVFIQFKSDNGSNRNDSFSDGLTHSVDAFHDLFISKFLDGMLLNLPASGSCYCNIIYVTVSETNPDQ